MDEHTTNLIELSAQEAGAALRSGEISAAELLEACIEQICRVNPVINAVVTTAFAEARHSARVIQKEIASNTMPLAGIPVLIKDNQLTAGIRTTLGSTLYADQIPTRDAGIVARIKNAGGIVIGKTNLPELSIGANTVNPLFGATVNPFQTDLTCGGSSGGSAAAIATHMAPLATGSDHGGSLRIPACFCGVVGYRATPGVVPNDERTISHTNYSVQGPIARNVADAALLLSVIANREGLAGLDPMAFPLDAQQFSIIEPLDPTSLSIAISADLGGLMLADTIRATFESRMLLLQQQGLRCEFHPVDLTEAPAVDWALRQDVLATQYFDFDQGAALNSNLLASLDAAMATPLLTIAKARRKQVELYRTFSRIFDDFDMLILPGVSVPPFPWTQAYPDEIDGQPVANYMQWLGLSSALTVVGHPVVAIPCGLDAQGTPFGLQVVGKAFNDARLLGMAKTLEDIFSSHSDLCRPISQRFCQG